MSLDAEAMIGGFAEPVYNSQSIFKMLMDGMARPGSLKTIVPQIAPPAPMGLAAGAIALTVCDADTPVWLTAGLSKSTVPAWLSFHCGATLTREKAEARFAFVEATAALSSFGLFATGTQEYPDRSVTVIIEIAGFSGGKPLALTGPGILGSTVITPAGLPDSFLRLWADNRALFPRGVDVVLTAGDAFLCLPRTSRITAKEA